MHLLYEAIKCLADIISYIYNTTSEIDFVSEHHKMGLIFPFSIKYSIQIFSFYSPPISATNKKTHYITYIVLRMNST